MNKSTTKRFKIGDKVAFYRIIHGAYNYRKRTVGTVKRVTAKYVYLQCGSIFLTQKSVDKVWLVA